jgi:hypothetical protein
VTFFAAAALTRLGALAEPQALVETTTANTAATDASNATFFNIRALLLGRTTD